MDRVERLIAAIPGAHPDMEDLFLIEDAERIYQWLCGVTTVDPDTTIDEMGCSL